MALLPLAASTRSIVPGCRVVGPAHPEERLEVTVRLCEGAGMTEVDKVYTFASQSGLTLVEYDISWRTVILSGPVGSMESAFGVILHCCEGDHISYRGRTGEVKLPAWLTKVVDAVLGLDNRPVASPRFVLRRPDNLSERMARANGQSGTFSMAQIARLYRFPKVTTVETPAIGIISLGGGWRPSDIRATFQALNLPAPEIVNVSVGGARNSPGSAADTENVLDICCTAAPYSWATGRPAKIVVYSCPNTDAGFLNGVTTLAHDAINKPVVGSISWGAPESGWTRQAMQQMDQAFQEAARLGVTFFAAAGDDGSADGVKDRRAHVDFPASSPHCTGCGGTHLVASGDQITRETVWKQPTGGATGGGVSAVFGVPPFQQGLSGLTMRGVPDVAGVADPQTGIDLVINGQQNTIGGTSAVAPLWAGLTAVLVQALGKRLGSLNEKVYALSAGVFNDIVQGDNAVGGPGFRAGPGWDATTGLGSPNGEKLLGALGGGPLPSPPPGPPLPPPPTPGIGVTVTISDVDVSHISVPGYKLVPAA